MECVMSVILELSSPELCSLRGGLFGPPGVAAKFTYSIEGIDPNANSFGKSKSPAHGSKEALSISPISWAQD